MPACRNKMLQLTTLLAVALGGSNAWASDDQEASMAGFGLQLGGMVLVAPKYEGSSDYRVIGVPFIAPSFAFSSGRVQFNGVDDIRFRVFKHGGFEAGPLAGWRFGRDEDDGDRLRGLGDVDGGLVVGGYMAYEIGMLKPFLSYHHQVTGDDGGGLLRFGSEAKLAFGHDVEVVGTLGATYADDDYMNAYFTITPAAAARSAAGLAAYQADAGLKDIYAGLAAKIPLSEAWTLRLTGRYSRLVGDAADSPVVEDANQFSAGAGITYKFNLR